MSRRLKIRLEVRDQRSEAVRLEFKGLRSEVVRLEFKGLRLERFLGWKIIRLEVREVLDEKIFILAAVEN